MKRAGALLFLALVGVLGHLAPVASAETRPAAEAEFVERLNGLRASKGLAALAEHGELTSLARRWAESMAGADEIAHNQNLPDQVKADWLKLGENVGVGMRVDALHDGFVASPTHYRNIVERAFTHVGVGVVTGRDGALFTTHLFMRLAPQAERAAPAPRPEARRASPAVPPRATQAGPSGDAAGTARPPDPSPNGLLGDGAAAVGGAPAGAEGASPAGGPGTDAPALGEAPGAAAGVSSAPARVVFVLERLRAIDGGV